MDTRATCHRGQTQCGGGDAPGLGFGGDCAHDGTLGGQPFLHLGLTHAGLAGLTLTLAGLPLATLALALNLAGLILALTLTALAPALTLAGLALTLTLAGLALTLATTALALRTFHVRHD